MDDCAGGERVLPYIVALAEALFYLWSVPVTLAVVMDSGTGLRLGAGVSAFVRHRARRRALSDLSAAHGGSGGPDRGAMLRVLRRVRFDRLELTGRASLGDAAATALLCGALNGLGCGLGHRAGVLRVAVRPDFSNDFHLELRGMLTARAGKVIAAALTAGRPGAGKEGRENGEASH